MSSKIYKQLGDAYHKSHGVVTLLGNPTFNKSNSKQVLVKFDRYVHDVSEDWRFPEGHEMLQIFIDKSKLNNLDFSSVTSESINY